MMTIKRYLGIIGLAASLSGAHLVDNSLIPKGGETLSVGQLVSINWTTQENHPTFARGIDIAFSKDGGATWQDIKENYGDNEKENTFNWTVPASAVTTQGKFRICQSGPCTNQNVSRPSAARPWYLVSNTFTVQASTSLVPQSQSQAGFSLEYRQDTRNVDVAFSLKAPGPVLLQAFDTRGRLVATLIEKDYAAGSHAHSVFSNALGAASGSLMFKLSAAGEVKTHTWMPLR